MPVGDANTVRTRTVVRGGLKSMKIRLVYRHADGRRVVIHYHHGGDTLPLGTLRNVLAGARWTEADLGRLGLL